MTLSNPSSGPAPGLPAVIRRQDLPPNLDAVFPLMNLFVVVMPTDDFGMKAGDLAWFRPCDRWVTDCSYLTHDGEMVAMQAMPDGAISVRRGDLLGIDMTLREASNLIAAVRVSPHSWEPDQWL